MIKKTLKQPTCKKGLTFEEEFQEVYLYGQSFALSLQKYSCFNPDGLKKTTTPTLI